MSEQPSDNLGGLYLDLARRIDAICRRFEADWRDGGRPPIDDYLAEVPTRAGRHSGPSWWPWNTSCARPRRRSHDLRPALGWLPSP